MTKADLVDTLADESGLTKKQVAALVDRLLDEIGAALRAGDRVQLIPFGTFLVRERAARSGRNPKTGEPIAIDARRIPAFTPGKGLRDAVAPARAPKNGARRKRQPA